MNDFAFKFRAIVLKNKRVMGIVFLMSMALIISSYFFLDQLFNQSSKDLVRLWLESELTNLQQGNVLSSVAKLQRHLDKASLIQGVRISDSENKLLFEIGKVSKATPSMKGSYLEIQDLRSGIFRTDYLVFTGTTTVLFSTGAPHFRYLFVGLAIYLLAIAMVFGFSLRNTAIKEEKLQHEMKLSSIQAELNLNQELARLSKQIAHDIRSPLQALEISLKDLSGVDQSRKDLISCAIERIQNIANELLQHSKTKSLGMRQSSSGLNKVQEVCKNSKVNCKIKETLIEIVNEKKLEFQERQVSVVLSLPDDELVIQAQKIDLQRIISNLINNSVEAVDGAIPTIQLFVKKYKKEVVLSLIDNGKGISADLLTRIGEEGFSSGKQSSATAGSGIGLFYAKSKMKEWSGRFEIASKVGQGTMVNLVFNVMA